MNESATIVGGQGDRNGGDDHRDRCQKSHHESDAAPGDQGGEHQERGPCEHERNPLALNRMSIEHIASGLVRKPCFHDGFGRLTSFAGLPRDDSDPEEGDRENEAIGGRPPGGNERQRRDEGNGEKAEGDRKVHQHCVPGDRVRKRLTETLKQISHRGGSSMVVPERGRGDPTTSIGSVGSVRSSSGHRTILADPSGVTDMNPISKTFVFSVLQLSVGVMLANAVPADGTPPSDESVPDPSRPFMFAREIWNQTVSASELLDSKVFSDAPDRSEIIDVPIGATDSGDGFIQRIRGWIEAPETGSYRFAIASDDDSVLLISARGDPSLAIPVASVTGFTGEGEFGDGAGLSRPITLIRGQRCYIEARHRDVDGADHLVVGWKVPRSGLDRPILIGTVLEPRFQLEVWEGVSRGDPRDFAVFQTPPTRSRLVFDLATPEGIGSEVATRLQGIWSAPADGRYRFMLSADDAAVLEVRTTDSSARLLGSATLLNWVAPGSWEGNPGQTTDLIPLQRAETVHLEVRHSQGDGPGHAAVGVVGAGIDERPITSPTPRRASRKD